MLTYPQQPGEPAFLELSEPQMSITGRLKPLIFPSVMGNLCKMLGYVVHRKIKSITTFN